MTALNGPTTKPLDTPSLKIALLRLLRDEAKPEGAYGHTALDNGSARCTVCGRPGAYYAPANQPNGRKVFQHKRGWAGRAKRSKVTLTPVDMAKRLGSDAHNVMHLLYSLKNAGLVSFRENKTGETKTLENIRLTTLGLSPTRKQWSVEERIANGMFQTEAFSDTEIANDVAVDGVITKVGNWVFAEDEASVLRDAAMLALEAETNAETALGITEPHVEPDGETPTEGVIFDGEVTFSGPGEPPTESEQALADALAQRISPKIGALNGEKYPGLMDLLTRESKRHDALEATTLLERAGLIDLATQVVTAIPDNTELEQEVIDYLAEIGVRP